MLVEAELQPYRNDAALSSSFFVIRPLSCIFVALVLLYNMVCLFLLLFPSPIRSGRRLSTILPHA